MELNDTNGDINNVIIAFTYQYFSFHLDSDKGDSQAAFGVEYHRSNQVSGMGMLKIN